VWWHFCASFAQIWGARHGLFELAKSEKSGGGGILPEFAAGDTGSDGINSVMGGAWLPHLRDFWNNLKFILIQHNKIPVSPAVYENHKVRQVRRLVAAIF
jgi:hypothetical protein